MHRSHNEIPDDYVAMGRHQCPCCLEIHNSGEILINMRLRSIPKNKTVTGHSPCEKCAKLERDGYIALVEANAHSRTATTINEENATRTGRILHIRREAFRSIFNLPGFQGPMCFIDPEAFNLVVQMYKDQTGIDLLAQG